MGFPTVMEATHFSTFLWIKTRFQSKNVYKGIKKGKSRRFYSIIENPNYDPITDNDYEGKRRLFPFLCIYTRFFTENASKRTRMSKNGLVSLAAGNPGCHPNTPKFFPIFIPFCVFKRVFENFCLIGYFLVFAYIIREIEDNGINLTFTTT
jgi:hypothetical protein